METKKQVNKSFQGDKHREKQHGHPEKFQRGASTQRTSHRTSVPGEGPGGEERGFHESISGGYSRLSSTVK